MTEHEVRNYFRDPYELGADASVPLAEKIAEAITVGRDRLGVDYGVLSYTGSGEYEVIGSTIENGDYSTGSVHDLDKTWCRHVVEDEQMLMILTAKDTCIWSHLFLYGELGKRLC